MKSALCAEVIGTLFLVMTVVGSGIMAEHLSGGIDGLALIGNSLATGAMLLVGLYISAGYWLTSSISFTNLAVTLVRVFTDSYSGIAPSAVLFFIMSGCWQLGQYINFQPGLPLHRILKIRAKKLIPNTLPSLSIMSLVFPY